MKKSIRYADSFDMGTEVTKIVCHTYYDWSRKKGELFVRRLRDDNNRLHREVGVEDAL
jgi:predicted transcriptional regulator